MKVAIQKTIPVTELKPAEYNPRKKLKPGDKEYEKIKNSIEEFGFADPLVVNSDMTIIGGHQRLTVAMDLGYTEVPCAVVDVDKTREKALNIALNKITGAWDDNLLADLLKDIQDSNFDLGFTGFEPPEIETLFNKVHSKDVKEDDFDVEKELNKPVFSKLGDLWLLGKHTVSQPMDLNEENYPYRKRLFCAKCGYPLQRAVRAGRVLWECSGQNRFSKDFCMGVSVDDDTVRSWLPIEEPIYITETADRGRITGFEYEAGSTWKVNHSKKHHVKNVPELTEENYPYMSRIYCKYCGSRLRRYIGKQDKVFWICNEMSRHGKDACKGVRVPDEKLQALRTVEGSVYIGKETINGKENYGYSRKPDKGKE